MTLHTAKGLEFPVVFLTGMEHGVFPHQRAMGDTDQLSEERRLAYVGLTRAEHRLFLTRAESRSLWGQVSYNPPSQFLAEIPEHLLHLSPDSVTSRTPGSRGSALSGFGSGSSLGRTGWGGDEALTRGRMGSARFGAAEEREPRPGDSLAQPRGPGEARQVRHRRGPVRGGLRGQDSGEGRVQRCREASSPAICSLEKLG